MSEEFVWYQSLSHQRFSDDRGGELYLSTAHSGKICAVEKYNSPPLSSENLWWLRLGIIRTFLDFM